MIYLDVISSNSASTDNLPMSLEMKNGIQLHVLFALLEIDEIKLQNSPHHQQRNY